MGGFAGTDSGQVVFFAIQKDAPRWQVTSWDWRQGSSALRTLNDRIQKPGTVVVSEDGRLVAALLDKRVQVSTLTPASWLARLPLDRTG